MDGRGNSPAGQGDSALGAFQARLAAVPPTRLAGAVRAISARLHDLVCDLRPTPDELRAALDFVTEVGHYTDARRHEWVLLADALGLSAAVEEMHARRPPGATPNTLAGPFYRADVPETPMDGDLSRDGKGEPLRVSGRVLALGGGGVAGARIEVWQANHEGFYENQQPDLQPEFNLRGRLAADAQGRFRFRSVKPGGYALPAEGPVGRLMQRLGLPLDRPAHLHFRVCAPGFQTLTTQIFDRADPAIGRDAIFGVKPELLAEFRALPSPDGRRAHALDLDLVLCPLGQGAPRQPETGRTQTGQPKGATP